MLPAVAPPSCIMKTCRIFARLAGVIGWVVCATGAIADPLPAGAEKELPDLLKEWTEWVTWDDHDLYCPTPYNDPMTALGFWPSRLVLEVERTAGSFSLDVTTFKEAWVPLPGGEEAWPVEVNANGTPLPVVEHKGSPAVKLTAGTHELQGVWRWRKIPQRIALPSEIGILSLTLEGLPVDAPVWDAKGFLWLKRDAASEEVDKDFLGVKLHSVIEDGIPLWLRTELELAVAGKSREEEIGVILPQGWKLAAVESQIPVAVDERGQMKAQVRAGKWIVQVTAFRLDHPAEISYAPGSKPAVTEQFVAFRSRPDFRLVEIAGIPLIDVSQTPFPDKWRELPVYRWDTGTPFQMEERMRGMGMQTPEGLHIVRDLWLDDNGRALTFRDRITGTMQQVWRLDAAEGQDLGSVRTGGKGQLITRNPQTGAPGVELRTRAIDIEATGRMQRGGELSATGWNSDADGLEVTLNLPPGWRLFALFGADWVQGDWLTAWSLLDLFLLLIFSLAVFRLWGIRAAALAFLAFGLSYHEPGAPRYVWLVLLVPLALIRVVPAGWGHRILTTGKWLTVSALVLILVPFLAHQINQSLYPQLEQVGSHSMWNASSAARYSAPQIALKSDVFYEAKPQRQAGRRTDKLNANLMYDSKAVIQTGPGVPLRTWRSVSFGWSGPVQAAQKVRPILIPLWLERVLAILRVVLLVALAGYLLNARRLGGFLRGSAKKAAAVPVAVGVAALCIVGTTNAPAEVPTAVMLETLRTRLLEKSDAYPTAADIPAVTLSLQGRKLTIDAEIHTAIRTAVPLPGRLPAWSPLSVTVNGRPEAVLRRDDGFLWLVLPAGVHQVRVEGALLHLTEWEWVFKLKPRRVTINAPGWLVSGVRADGTPEAQVFFSRKVENGAGEASYDRPDLQPAVAVDRHLELGLLWQVRTTASRLSPDGKAVALRVPLLPGENVITPNVVVKEGFVEVRLGAHQPSFTWESELTMTEALSLATKPDDEWVERWHLVASPVWNIAMTGLAPAFETSNPDLVPVWKPWPGESVDLSISRPGAVPGATVTVSEGTHVITLGKRQRTSSLDLILQCSIGTDFLVGLPAGAEASTLTRDGQAIPVRKDGDQVIVPLQPGRQRVVVGWKSNMPLGFRARAEGVRLPVESANIDTSIHVPDDRWVLWASGPLQGPAVRFWVILISSLLAACVLGRIADSPLHTIEWMLLAIGLTQIPLPVALVVIGWLFFLRWRGSESFRRLPAWAHNFLQVFLIGLTLASLGIFIAIVAAGLLGNPEMFISGNGSSRTVLNWYQARCDTLLPQPDCLSVSIWWYRFLMLVWALWLAASLIRWLRWAWQQFSSGACFRKGISKKDSESTTPPPIPTTPRT